jgi:hypothetical protein
MPRLARGEGAPPPRSMRAIPGTGSLRDTAVLQELAQVALTRIGGSQTTEKARNNLNLARYDERDFSPSSDRDVPRAT